MGEWKKTGCVMCAQNCGLEVLVEDGRLVKSRPDKDNPRSQGYACRKGLNVAFHQHHAQRLTQPLKRVNGRLEPVSWDQALDEIAARLRAILDAHGPRSLAYMGGGGQACHFEAAFGVRLLRALGSHYHYNALGQELTGYFWGAGRMFGKQYLGTIPDEANATTLVAWGWNGWMSHQIPQARRVLHEFSRNPDKTLVAVDPRRSETAARADIHLALNPGTDALLLKAMIALILAEGWENRAYLAAHASGWEETSARFRDFDIAGALAVCGLEDAPVRELCRLLTSRPFALHPDLGVFMNRHSTLTTWLIFLLMTICGAVGVPGGSVIPGTIMPLGTHSDEREPKTWRTVATDYPAIMGVFPPNVMPEEILSDHPDRLRAVICSQSNPLRSYADTTAYAQAFAKLDLLVVCEVAMSETAALAHYVLPAKSGYESWDGSFFPLTWPEIYFQMRRPVVEPQGEPWEVSQIYTALAGRLGLIPPIPDSLRQAAAGDRLSFGMAFMGYAAGEPKAQAMAPFILAETLGKTLGSANLAALWGLLMTAPKSFQKCAARAGFSPGPAMGEQIFQALLDNPQGLWIGKSDPENNLGEVRTADGRINLAAPEMTDWLATVTPQAEAQALAPDPEFPLILMAGRHMDFNANTLMRDPAWNKGKRACTLAMHPDDAAALGLADGDQANLATQAGAVSGEVEVTAAVRAGTVLVPHGFGLEYQGVTYGVNVNQLTPAANRDSLAGTPLHRYVPCKVEKTA